VKHVVSAILYLIKHHENVVDLIQQGLKIRGDTATLLGLSLGIVAAREGLSELDPNLINRLEDNEILRAKANEWKDFVMEWE